MAPKPKSKRGGARKGAGRKPKSLILQASMPEIVVAVEAKVERIEKSNAGPASGLVPTAYDTLRDVMLNSPFQAPRVTAARAIIELAKAEQASANAPTGKKAETQAAAHIVATAPTDGWGDDLMMGDRAN